MMTCSESNGRPHIAPLIFCDCKIVYNKIQTVKSYSSLGQTTVLYDIEDFVHAPCAYS